MSKTVDQRIVEMRFDNKQFEQNVQASLTTLGKLRQSLNLKDSVKGLENLGAASKKLDVSPLANSIETVQTKFSALQVIGVTALANITNSAVNAGKRIVSALTIDPVKTGFQEYETQINAVQTILANTSSAGTTLDDVTKALDELNAYADKTIYNFTEMTRNIGTFTAAGVDLQTSVTAIQGIANLAAISGSTSQQASVAMYQLSQALSSGTVKLMDWNSVVNAGMGGKVFQDALVETARVHGVAIDSMIKDSGSFRETLSEGWLTADILTETLEKFTMTTEGLTEAEIEANREKLRNIGYTEDQIDAIFKLGKTSTDAATKVKTFTQLWDVLKEAAQSGWTKTWQLLIGDFEEAKTVWTSVSDVLTGIINNFSDARNAFLESALGMGFEKLQDSISKVLGPIEKVVDGTDKVTESLKSLDEIVDDVLNGEFGNGDKRFEKLTDAGYNYCKVQNKINETLGNNHRYTKEQIEAQDKLIASQNKSYKQVDKTVDGTKKLTKAQKEQIKKMAAMSEAQAEANGYTKDQVEALRDLNDIANKLGMPLDELIDHIDELNGRWILLNSFANIGENLGRIFGAIADAFKDVFSSIKPEDLFDAIAGFHKFTEQMIISDRAVANLRDTFKGLFAIVDIFSRIFGGGLRIAVTVITSILKAFGTTVLGVTGNIGELIYKFDEWLKEHDIITKFIETLAEKIPDVIEGVKEFAKALYIDSGIAENFERIAAGLQSIWSILHGKVSLAMTSVMKIIGSVFSLFGTTLGEVLAKAAEWVVKVVEWIDKNTFLMNGIKEIAELISVLIEGIGDCIKAFLKLEPVQKVIENIKNAFKKLVDVLDFNFEGNALETLLANIKNVFGKLADWISSLGDSEMLNAGLDIVEGLAIGIVSGIGKAVEAMLNMATQIITAIKGALGINSPSRVMMAIGGFIVSGLILGILRMIPQAWDAITGFTSGIVDKFQNGFEGIGEFFSNLWSKIAPFFEGFDFSSVIVIGTIVAMLVLLKKALDIADKIASPIEAMGNMFKSFGKIADSIGDYLKAKKFEAYSTMVLNFAKAIGILAASLALLSMLDQKSLWSSVGALAAITVVLTGMVLVIGLFKNLSAVSFGKLGVMLLSLGVALMMMSTSMKILSTIDAAEANVAIRQMIVLMTGILALVAIFGLAVKADASDNIGKVGTMLIKMGVAIALLAVAMKLMSGMEPGDIYKGAAIIGGAMAIFAAFMVLSKFSGESASKVGSMIIKMSLAIGLLAVAIKMISLLKDDEITRGMTVIVAIELLFMALLAVSHFAGANAAKAGLMFSLMATAVMILATSIRMIASLPPEDVRKGLAFIAVTELLFGAIMVLSQLVGKRAAKAGAMFLMMAAAVMILATTVKIIAGIPEDDIDKGLAVITAVELLFMSIMLLSKYAGKNADKAGTMFLKMSAGLLILVGAIAILSLLKIEDIITGTAAISALMGMFALLMKMSGSMITDMKPLIVMSVAIGVLAGTLIALSAMDPSKVLTASTALSMVLGMLAVVVDMTQYAKSATATLVVLAATIALIGGVLKMLAKMPVESAIGISASLSLVLMALAGAFFIISKATAAIVASIPALAAMVGAVALIALILAALYKLDINISMETASSLSVLLLSLSVACGILAVAGAAAPAAVAGALALDAVIVAIGGLIVGIGALMDKYPVLEDFLEKGIDILEKISYGLGSVLGSFVGGALDGVLSGLPGMGKHLGDFMTNAQPFIDGAASLDSSIVDNTKNLADAIMTFVKADVKQTWLGSGASFASFGEKLAEFGPYMRKYADSVAGIDTESIKASAGAAKALAEVANAMPNEGGVSSWFAGENDIVAFAQKLKPFGEGMKGYADAVAGIDSTAIQSSATAAKGLAEVAAALPNEGAVASWFAGENDIQQFAYKLIPFGECLKKYAGVVEGINAEAIQSSAKAAKGLANVANALPNEGGVASWFAGDNDLSSFGTNIVTFGESLKTYSETVGSVDAGAVSNSVTVAKKVLNFINGLADIDTSGINDFKDAISDLAKTEVKKFVTTFDSYSGKLKTTGATMLNHIVNGLKSRQSALNSTASYLIEVMAKGINAKTASLHKAGVNLVNEFVKGIKSKDDSVKKAVETLCKKGKNGAEDYKDDFKTAGKNLGAGLINGINAKKQAAYNAGYALGQKAAQGVKDGSDEASPSKLTYQYGIWQGEGLINGIVAMGKKAYKAGYNLGNTAATSMSDAIAKVSDLLNTDMDSQPTIRPVLDLSDVQSGVGTIGSMLNLTPSVGVMANLGAINSMMNDRSQNGDNSDVVAAINKLRKDLGNVGGTTNVINGVTYDDGSNIVDAVSAIVRAAKVERRI